MQLKYAFQTKQYHIIQHTIMATPTFGVYMSIKNSLF